jgi:peptidoglycan biosynthesis protein MviN/MurJ (putative lipid II flippase)
MFFGFCILCIGVPLLIAPNKESFELSLAVLLLAGGGLMLVGGYQTMRNAKQKDTAVNEYELSVKEQLKEIQNLQSISNSSVVSSEINSSNNYTPDIIAIWQYSKEEWRLMTKEETARRLKEGIWVSLLVGLLGSWVLHSSRGVNYITGLFISLCVGVFISLLKVLVSNAIFRLKKSNSIIITTNALIINGKFKTINDNDIKLEYVKSLKIKENHFIEFSL